MRVHSLELTAFGPFPGSQRVDLDSLAESGLFLLCGPTGAGKTSVLDAVCFGLYGEVPGERNAAKRLRSDHAAMGVAPSVVVEVTLGGRRFRIRRSPAWTRPKRRGTGTTTEQPRVVLEESVTGRWRHLSSRLDETGQLVAELLGMNMSQFCQVAMLPQGGFASFLRARSEDRHRVLQQLFRTGRFEEVERWLVARRQALKGAARTHQEAVASVVSRICEAASAELSEGWQLGDLAAPAASGDLSRWAGDLLASAAAAVTVAATELAGAVSAAEAARGRLERARRVVELRERHRRATVHEQALLDDQAQGRQAQVRLEAARRATGVLPVARLAEEAQAAADASERELATVLTAAAARLGTTALQVTSDDLSLAERAAREAVTVARALLPREAELRSAHRARDAAATRLRELEARAARLEPLRRVLPDRLMTLRTRMTEQVAVAADLAVAVGEQDQLGARLAAARRRTRLQRDREAARERLRDSAEAAAELRERMHAIREARINGMAAELATALAAGGSCPVCGSAQHPRLARPVSGAATSSDEDAARTAYENAAFTRQASAEALSTLERNLAVADHTAGGADVAALEAALEDARGRERAAEAAANERARLERDIEALERELEGVTREAGEHAIETARLTQQRDDALSLAAKVTAELAALFGAEQMADGVERLARANAEAGEVFATARKALAARDAARGRAGEAAAEAARCATEHGFSGAQAAVVAALPISEQAALEGLLRSRQEQLASVRTVLGDEEVRAAVSTPIPDLTREEGLAELAEEHRVECGARWQNAQERVSRLRRLVDDLSRALAAWAPTREAHELAHSLSTFAEGKAADNTLQMRLSAYVLSSRLSQVVAAANERLCRMSDQRYALEHSVTRGVGELRGGLSLLVRDQWTGEARDPATLSGGETFVVSLALALGLADVVSQEAGGSSIGTLFVDEGFGTLDPDTLDDVLDALDGLREGGRVVGVVSHVPELRTRIPAQLQVRKHRSGSCLVAARETV